MDKKYWWVHNYGIFVHLYKHACAVDINMKRINKYPSVRTTYRITNIFDYLCTNLPESEATLMWFLLTARFVFRLSLNLTKSFFIAAGPSSLRISLRFSKEPILYANKPIEPSTCSVFRISRHISWRKSCLPLEGGSSHHGFLSN